MLVTEIRKEIIETAETVGASKDYKESEGKYSENFAQVLCIWYPIIFWKKSVPISTLFDLGSKVNAIYPTFD